MKHRSAPQANNLPKLMLLQQQMVAQTAQQANGQILDPNPVATLSLVLLASIRLKQLQHQLLTDARLVV